MERTSIENKVSFDLSDFPQNSSILFSYNEDDAIFMSKRSASGDLISSTKDIYSVSGINV